MSFTENSVIKVLGIHKKPYFPPVLNQENKHENQDFAPEYPMDVISYGRGGNVLSSDCNITPVSIAPIRRFSDD